MHKYLHILSFSFLLVLLSLSQNAEATHNRAGEITFVQLGPLTIEATITTYTKASSVLADRDSLRLVWGDGSSTVIQRSNGNGNGVILPGTDIKYNIYVAQHTYPGRGTYTLSMTDRNRIGGILNVNPPNSVNIPFHIETTFTLLDPQFQGFNSSAILNQPPIDIACVGERFIHIPNASDPDGDSLSYELIVPFQGVDNRVPNYSFPDQIEPGPDNMISLDPLTGEFVWDAPQKAGEYNIAMYINEYRNGDLINRTIRDMQILVENCNNQPPEFEIPDEICVIAGEKVEIPIEVTDPDVPEQKISVTAVGGPVNRGASLDIDDDYYDQPVNTTFEWQTSCNDISAQYYSVVIRAVDNGIDTSLEQPRGLATLKSLRIKVVGPPPENKTAEVVQNQVRLSWDSPYDCEITEDEYFRGFTVWRRPGSAQATIDSCNSDLEALGYQQIAFEVMEEENDRYYYIDKGVEAGNTYCYRITGEFAQTTPAGNPYNIVESLPTDEMCIIVNRDLPALQNVSVRATDTDQGIIFLRWLKPDLNALDTTENPGPYAFSIERSEGIGTSDFSPIPGSMTDFTSFQSLNDTIFTDSLLNTLENPYTYRIAFYTGGNAENPYGYSAPASSVFLNTISTDRTNILEWDFAVPWFNYKYNIFRRNESTGNYFLLDSTEQLTYRDENLSNGEEYCYYIESIGSYGIPTLNDTLYNNSQNNCGVPIDTLAPCPPELLIDNICISSQNFNFDQLVNQLRWEFNGGCAPTPDLTEFRIYYSPDSTTEMTLIEEISATQDEFIHSPERGLQGCYSITAVDSVGNESEMSNKVCVQNCPLYELPNAFTPNNDGSNDNLQPISNRFIERIDLKVYNRWGNLVFETTDPAINWDGTNQSGEILSPATYYYVCKVYEAGNTSRPLLNLSGYIEIIH